MENFTFDDYTEFLNNEKQFIDNLRNVLDLSINEAKGANATSVDNVIAYSKTLSVKQSKKLGSVKIMLN